MAAGTGAGARHTMADQLRGIALLGIVVVNVPYLAISGFGYDPASVAAPLDRAVAFAVAFLAEGKFYLIFSLLFGYSTTFIIRPDDPLSRRRYLRRLAGLAVLGFLHAVLLFTGDILMSYALLGLVLLWVMPWSDEWLLKLARLTWVIVTGWFALLVVTFGGQETGELDALFAEFDQALATGSFWDTVVARLTALPDVLLTLASLQWGLAFAAFCAGLVAGRHKLFADPAAHLQLWRRAAVWGLSLGLPLQAAAAWLATTSPDGVNAGQQGLAGLALGFATAPVLAAGYVGLFGLICAHRPRAFAIAEPAGRMSLTVYLGESLLLCVLYCGWGLGWFGTQGAAAVTLVAMGVWVVLAVFAWAWLRRYSRGPMESLMNRWVRRGAPGSEPSRR